MKLSSNDVWHAHRTIARIKIFTLGVSLTSPIYVKKEWTGKKLFYIKIKYITLDTEKFSSHF